MSIGRTVPKRVCVCGFEPHAHMPRSTHCKSTTQQGHLTDALGPELVLHHTGEAVDARHAAVIRGADAVEAVVHVARLHRHRAEILEPVHAVILLPTTTRKAMRSFVLVAQRGRGVEARSQKKHIV